SSDLREILLGLPRGKKIWEQELLIRIGDAFDLAYKALNRNMLEIFNEAFPRPVGDNSLEAFERLDKKFIELTVDKQSLSWEMGEKYIRSHMEVVYAWDVVLLISVFMSLLKESSTTPSELFCLMNSLGKSCGLLKTLEEDQNNLLKEAHNRIKQSQNAQKPRPSALENLIEEIMIKNPKIKPEGMLAKLEAKAGNGVIDSITDEEIEWTDYGGKITDTKISALKDRMFRAKKKILSR
ncbi:MAG: hypothetical protein HGB26_09215, partial [Desulfobulbaceae bacterium]|nr:hypothetical protein [Desulfobulbaceae bacterium]